nr:MAG TPA: Helix-turn-helix XRE-family like protein [Caudoviricetes sp.]
MPSSFILDLASSYHFIFIPLLLRYVLKPSMHKMYFFVCILKVHIVLLFHGYYGGHMSNLRKYRESLNISQTTLAKAVGCTQGAIGHWESGRRFPDLKTCRALVECLNKLGAKVSLDDVFPPEHKAA